MQQFSQTNTIVWIRIIWLMEIEHLECIEIKLISTLIEWKAYGNRLKWWNFKSELFWEAHLIN